MEEGFKGHKRYLGGVILDRDLTWKARLKIMMSKACRAFWTCLVNLRA
jgi:hypothetical protein